MRICELKNKEVINAVDCKILGYVSDIDVDLCSGKVLAIVVPGPGKLLGFLCRESEYIIPYDCISKVGPDIIIVNVCEDRVLVKSGLDL